MAQERADALDLQGIFFSRTVLLAIKCRLPSLSVLRQLEAGGVMRYGTDVPESFSTRCRAHEHKILQGAKPPTKFDLVINLKTEKALGLTVPQRCSPVPTLSAASLH